MAADPDLVAQLRPVRLPPGFDAFDFHGALAIFALALLAGLLLALLLRRLTVPRLTARRAAEHHLAAIRHLQADERLLRQSQLVAELKQRAQKTGQRGEPARQRLAELRTTIDAELYRPKPALDPDALDTAILDVVGAGAKQ